MSVAILERAAIGRPITRLGASIFPLYLPGQPAPFSFTTGISGDVTVSEKPNAEVPILQVTNREPLPVLIHEGQLLDGGRQTRTVNVSILVPAGITLDIPVSCVESGRWHGGDRFVDSNRMASRRVRRAKQMGVRENLSYDSSRHSDQGSVWSAVDYELNSRQVASSSSNYRDIEEVFENDSQIAEAIDELVKCGPLTEQRGVVVAHGSRVVSAEIFATYEALHINWEAVIRGIILDAPGQAKSRPSATAVLRFLRGISVGEIVTAPGVGLGTEEHVKSRVLIAHGLSHEGVLVHASAFALAA